MFLKRNYINKFHKKKRNQFIAHVAKSCGLKKTQKKRKENNSKEGLIDFEDSAELEDTPEVLF